MEDRKKHLIVIGGGAAGMFCAANAAAFGLRVTVLEKTGKLLSKVRVSGGGRCNVTHACADTREMSRQYPRGEQFVRKTFFQWAPADTVTWFRERGVPLKTEPDGRMFPVTDSSQTIIDCLVSESNRLGVEFRMHAEVKEVSVAAGERFRVSSAGGQVMEADFVCVACGGYPRSPMFDWIRRLGHTIEEPVPSLFTFNMPAEPITRLAGISVPEAQVKIAGTALQQQGPLLVTHWGLSGPVILRLSAWGARQLSGADYRFDIRVNWLPGQSGQQVRDRLQEARYEWASRQVRSGNPFRHPRRLWEHWLAAAQVAGDVRWADLPARDQNKLVNLVCAGEFSISGKTTFKEEFVTAGGVRLAEVDPANCQSRKIAGLFFAGEVLDVDGITGGYNFQHAWTSGWIVAKAAAGATRLANDGPR